MVDVFSPPVTPDEGGWERRLVTELEKQEKEVQRMREQQEFSLLRVRAFMTADKILGTETKGIFITRGSC